jgi:hypothetical protein
VLERCLERLQRNRPLGRHLVRFREHDVRPLDSL